MTTLIFKGPCPCKINAFLWLAWDNKILAIDNLFARGCDKLAIATCTFCHMGVELGDHFFFNCPVVVFAWTYFAQIFGFQRTLSSSSDLWGPWVKGLSGVLRPACFLIARAIIWLLWLGRNDCIFNSTSLSLYSLRLKICHIFLSWVDAVPSRGDKSLRSLRLRLDAVSCS